MFPEKVAPLFQTNDDRVVNFEGVVAMTSGGHVVAPTMKGAFVA